MTKKEFDGKKIDHRDLDAIMREAARNILKLLDPTNPAIEQALPPSIPMSVQPLKFNKSAIHLGPIKEEAETELALVEVVDETSPIKEHEEQQSDSRQEID